MGELRNLIAVLFVLSEIVLAQGVPAPPVPPNPLPTIPATQTNFQNCAQTQQRTAKDNMCPRLEGANLPHCCPPLEKRPAIECQYVKMIARGQPTLINSSYTTCQNGKNVQVPCCQPSAQDCFESPLTIQFIQRLISRSNQCCIEPCSLPEYWSAPPARPGLPADWNRYSYYPGGSSQCNPSTILNQCTVSGGTMCGASDFCPVTPTPTDPTPTDPTPTDPTPTDPTPTDPTPPVTTPPAQFGNG